MNASQILFGSSINRNGFINAYINKLTETFELSPAYYQITKTINGVSSSTLYDAWLSDEDSYKSDTPKKKIIMKPPQPLSRGEMINISAWGVENWIVTKLDPATAFYNNGLIEQCNNVLKFKDKIATLYEIPCIITLVNKTRLDVKDYILVKNEKNNFWVVMQYNDASSQITVDYRFIIKGSAYRVIAVDNISTKGIINVKFESDSLNANDDLINSIADNSLVIGTPVTITSKDTSYLI